MFQTEEWWNPCNSHIDIAIARSNIGNYTQTRFEVTYRVTMIARGGHVELSTAPLFLSPFGSSGTRALP